MNGIIIESNGRQTKHIAYLGGVEVGTRTSKTRVYPYALIGKPSQAWRLQWVRQMIGEHTRMAERYETIANAPTAEDAYRLAASQEFGRDPSYSMEYWRDGSYKKWGANSRGCIEKLEAERAELESGPLPRFDIPEVISWHMTRANVPSTPAHMTFVAIVAVAS